jgi:hypothetical protein
MLQAVGQAASDCAHVEEGLFKIFFKLMASPAMGPPSCTFVAADNFRTKLQMVDSMIRHTKAGRKVLSEWEQLQKRCNKLRMARNDLAHRKVAFLQIGKGKAQPALMRYNHDVRHHRPSLPWSARTHLSQFGLRTSVVFPLPSFPSF